MDPSNITHHPHQTGWRPHSWRGHWGPHEPPSWQRVLTSLETRSKDRSMQLNAVITFNITWCCTQHCGDWDTTSIKFKLTKDIPYLCPNGQAMGCLSCGFWRNLPMSYWHHAQALVSCFINQSFWCWDTYDYYTNWGQTKGWHFQMHILDNFYMYFDSLFTKLCS